MGQERRSSVQITDKVRLSNGPFLARIVSHLDPSFMGGLEVTLLKDQGNEIGDDSQSFVVRCAMPFFGYTAFEHMGQNDGSKNTLEGFNDTQKSYGMWFVPPDIGVNVLVFFVDGDPSQGFWMGCVPAKFSNNMVPGIAASTEVSLDDADKKRLNTKQPLPVAEINKRVNLKNQKINPDTIKKPLHPIVERFLEQGLLEDDVRGFTTSSGRREAPSMVYGISTPGPLDRRPGAKKSLIGKQDDFTQTTVPVSRLGGTQFVMDDGDDRYVRNTPASSGPVKYIDVSNGVDAASGEKTTSKGDPTIPYGECVRIRTRKGHQILLHNSEDLIYIGNAKGTTWIEMTANGKIDIYANDSVSLHTQTDLNIRADRDINLEAGRNINMKAISGRTRMEMSQNWEVLVGQDGKISVGGVYEHVAVGDSKITVGANFDLRVNGANKFTAGGTTDIKSGGNITQSGARIDLNSFPAATAAAASPISAIPTHDNIATSIDAGWAEKYNASTISSIMKRVPMHEPWPLHENQAPEQLTPSNTDREV